MSLTLLIGLCMPCYGAEAVASLAATPCINATSKWREGIIYLKMCSNRYDVQTPQAMPKSIPTTANRQNCAIACMDTNTQGQQAHCH